MFSGARYNQAEPANWILRAVGLLALHTWYGYAMKVCDAEVRCSRADDLQTEHHASNEVSIMWEYS
jgi:hypothetical protein